MTFDAFIIGAWVLISPYEYDEKEISENFSGDEIRKEILVTCTCKHENIFIIVMCCYKGLLLIFGAFLALQSRYAKPKIRQESKKIAVAIYNVIAISLIAIMAVALLSKASKYDESYGIIGGSIFVSTTATNFLLFLSKVNSI